MPPRMNSGTPSTVCRARIRNGVGGTTCVDAAEDDGELSAKACAIAPNLGVA